MKKNYYILVVLLLLLQAKIQAGPTVTFFFKPFADVDTITQSLKKPGNLVHHQVHGIVQHAPVAGLLTTYGGYIDSSNYNGEVSFPRKHTSSNITIVITTEMVPVPLFENTILHWQLIPGVAAKMYSCEKKYNEAKEESYWDTKEVPLPENNIIPLAAMVIIARPKDIVINEGIAVTTRTANLLLPDIYVKKGINIIQNSSYILTIRHLFKPVEEQERPEPLKMLTHIID